tara:strand:+ start:44 stop:271 length:228 start_codon:yes stop_codon:yes gene_type:complete
MGRYVGIESSTSSCYICIKETKMKNWIKSRIAERTSWDGAVCIGLGVMILFMAPLAKIAAGLAIAWGVWTIWKAE